MKLTCVTATFNCIRSGNKERLIRCVESVANLKTEHEHLIYDGASTDGTVELLRELELKTQGLKVVSEPDTGIYNALNKGVREAKGEWFYVLGADDYIARPLVMEEIIDIEGNEAEHIVAPVWRISASTGKRLGGVQKRNIFFGTPYCHQGVLMRTSLVRQCGGFDEVFKVFADYALFVESHLRGSRIRYVNAPFAVYSTSGFSSEGHGTFPDECMRISHHLLGVSNREIEQFRRTAYFPLKRVIPYIFHRDATLRLGAFCMLAKNILGHLGLYRWRKS